MRLKERYQKEIKAQLKKELSLSNDLLIPKLKKVVINVGFGRQAKEKETIKRIELVLAKISGQKAVLNKAKKSISAFKIREGMLIGAKVSLRGDMMYDFVERLIAISFPRVRDFRGINKKGVDAKGNMTIGIKEYSCFPELSAEDLDYTHGLEISFDTSARNREEGLALFSALGFPFQKDE